MEDTILLSQRTTFVLLALDDGESPFIYFGPEKANMGRCEKENKVKGYINIHGYRVILDDTANPGRYGFRIIHDANKSHAFASDEHAVVRDWMKALMKATIDRDYTRMSTQAL